MAFVGIGSERQRFGLIGKTSIEWRHKPKVYEIENATSHKGRKICKRDKTRREREKRELELKTREDFSLQVTTGCEREREREREDKSNASDARGRNFNLSPTE